ncbi:hypothetical protein [Halobacillus ihumii]|uniref:hypothetical protein n=1 Tax=Halobacillus ihumii TaxID=2686092 RepID=UPI0013D7CBDA|nr:hypothetical protein [Halobacillus ihumii]
MKFVGDILLNTFIFICGFVWFLLIVIFNFLIYVIFPLAMIVGAFVIALWYAGIEINPPF